MFSSNQTNVAAVPNYIEDVFSTYLYTGNSSTQTITNNIDLSTKGGLVWIKSRSDTTDNFLFDTIRGALNEINSNNTQAQASAAASLTAFNTNGFSLGNSTQVNFTGETQATWTFRKQPKFFDVVTYTGTGSNTTIAHSLGSVPGCIMVKRTDTTADWAVYHRSLAKTQYLVLNTTAAAATGATWWNSTTPTSAVFSVGTDASVNASGGTYVAYLFAHNAGGFGLTGTDNVISCGSFTTDGGGGASVTLGYEPQWLLIKRTDGVSQWYMADVMRGMPVGANSQVLYANLSAAEGAGNTYSPTATGFIVASGALVGSSTYIYIAIRRGPMKVPTDATKVFLPYIYAGNGGSNRVITPPTNSPVDLMFGRGRTAGNNTGWYDRLRGKGNSLTSNTTAAESVQASSPEGTLGQNNFTVDDTYGFLNSNGVNYAMYLASRAPSFFDEVCYTGSNGYQDLSHNLGVTPEMVIIKNRSSSQAWIVGLRSIVGTGKYLVLNTTAAVVSDANYFGGPWTNTYVEIDGNIAPINQSGSNYVMYLFATAAGVSKVGSYSGTGATQTVDCGFSGGARWVMVKRTDSTGDWYVWDTARGMVSGTDPSLLLNSTTAEVNANSIYTATTGFQIVSTAAGINASGGTYIFLAIA